MTHTVFGVVGTLATVLLVRWFARSQAQRPDVQFQQNNKSAADRRQERRMPFLATITFVFLVASTIATNFWNVDSLAPRWTRSI